EDVDGTVVVDVDLGAGGLGDLADDLTAATDDFADLLLRNLDGGDARRGRAKLRTRGGERFARLIQDVHPAGHGLVECDLHHLLGDAVDFNIHLQGGDTVHGACHFEIHVAKMILVAHDVGKHGEVLAFEHEAHGNARHRLLERYARIHQRQ